MKIEIRAVPYSKEGHKMIRITSETVIYNPVMPGRNNWKMTHGLWDTGATNTCIPMKTALDLGIPLGDEFPMRMGSSTGHAKFCKFYLRFPEGVIEVNEGAAVENMKTGLIIGMDVIGKGKTIIEPTADGGVRFTFTV